MFEDVWRDSQRSEVFDVFSEHRLDNTWVPWANNFKIWTGGIVVPEDRNSTSARNYVWSYSNETVSDAIFPWSNRTTFPETVDETCLYLDATGGGTGYVIKESACSVGSDIPRVLCESIRDKPLN